MSELTGLMSVPLTDLGECTMPISTILPLILLAFYVGSTMLPESSLPVVATLTTVVSTALISMLRQVVTGERNGHDEKKDHE